MIVGTWVGGWPCPVDPASQRALGLPPTWRAKGAHAVTRRSTAPCMGNPFFFFFAVAVQGTTSDHARIFSHALARGIAVGVGSLRVWMRACGCTACLPALAFPLCSRPAACERA
jgi:hypothetical protein